MSENIIVAVMAVFVVGISAWVWWLENGLSAKSKAKETDGKEEKETKEETKENREEKGKTDEGETD